MEEEMMTWRWGEMRMWRLLAKYGGRRATVGVDDGMVVMLIWRGTKCLEKNNTWELTTLPQGKIAIGGKLVLKIKHKADGNIESYKARLVAKRLNQKAGIEYNETFAPVARMVTLRTLLAVSIQHDWIIEKLDINNAFLHEDLNEEVYMQVPQGYSHQFPPNTVCKLKKSLYGLKQTNKQWFEKLTTFLKSLGYKQSYVDTSLFTFKTAKTSISLLVYVDDILIAGNDKSLIESLKTSLDAKFSIKDLGPIHYYLGIEFLRNTDRLALTQRKYALDLVTYAGLLDVKPSVTPLDPNKKLIPNNGNLLPDPSFYRALVGKLLYLTITRPNLSFAAQALSQFLQQPRTTHMKALLKVIIYIKLSIRQGLLFPTQNTLHLTAYCDSDWVSFPFTKRSVTEAEYRALADSTCEVTWIQCLLEEFQINVPTPIPIMCDNASFIAFASNLVHHARSKHIEIDCHFVRDKVKAWQILPQYISTKNQLDDILTKGLSRPLHYNCLTKLGMCNPYTLPTCEGDDKTGVK
uniref:Retrovirus-related Pol polyprotein from transposon TNT 1-94 n=1 Tax=Tanacetum cinerariifolium TaxID=118510 RepID=A0A6L2L8V1_TANCI|nr:retrovirus-related Pol polyprotein from transposon TNT 1-94 [Tanacetum cinerariifolium]